MPSLRRAPKPEDQQGFTLVEVVVALVLLGIIIVPLTAAFIQGLRRTGEIDQRLGRSADLQRISSAWERDVANVNANGINATADVCADPNTIPSAEVALISFSWDDLTGITGATVTPKSATWVVEGTGRDATLVRRYCVGGSPQSEAVLADSFGIEGVPALDLVHGPTTGQRDFCSYDPSNTKCTISVTGAYSYSLTTTRRVPGVASADAFPAPPTLIDAVPTNQTITVTWDPSVIVPPQSAVVNYNAIAATSCNGAAVSSALVDSQSTSASLTGLSNGTGYYVQVQAKNDLGWGSFSACLGPIVPILSPPGAPTNVVGTPLDKTASVDWADPVNNGGTAISAYVVYVSTTGAADGSGDITTFNAASKPFQLPDGSLKNGKNYYFSVQAINSTGTGPKSAYSTATMPFGAPNQMSTPASNVVYTVNQYSTTAVVVMSWQRFLDPNNTICLGLETLPTSDPAYARRAIACGANGSKVTGYAVTFTPLVTGGLTAPVAQDNVNVPSYGDEFTSIGYTSPNLDPGVAYNVTVAAINAAGTGPAGLTSFIILPQPSIYPSGNSRQFDFRVPTPVTTNGELIDHVTITHVASGKKLTVASNGNSSTNFLWGNSNITDDGGTANFSDFTRYAFTLQTCTVSNLCTQTSPTYYAMSAPTPSLSGFPSTSNPGPGTVRRSNITYGAGLGTTINNGANPGYATTTAKSQCSLGSNVYSNETTFPGPTSTLANPLDISGLPSGTYNCGIILTNRVEATSGGYPDTLGIASGLEGATSIQVDGAPQTLGTPTVAKPATGTVDNVAVTSSTPNPSSGVANDPTVEYRATCSGPTQSAKQSPWGSTPTVTVSGLTPGAKGVSCYMQIRSIQHQFGVVWESAASPNSATFDLQRTVPVIESVTASRAVSVQDGAGQNSNFNKLFALVKVRTDPGISVTGLRWALNAATSGSYNASIGSGANTAYWNPYKTEAVGNDLRTYVLVIITPPNNNWAGIPNGSPRAVSLNARYAVQFSGDTSVAGDTSVNYWAAIESNASGVQDFPVGFDSQDSTAGSSLAVGGTIHMKYQCDDNDAAGSNDDECDSAAIRIRNLATNTPTTLSCATRVSGSDTCETRSGATNGFFNADDNVVRTYNVPVPAGTASGLYLMEAKFCNEDGACPSGTVSGYGVAADTDYETIGYFFVP